MSTNQDNGNMAAMRKALMTIRKRLVAAYVSESEFMRLSPDKPLADLIDAALAEPPRNCDVGTVEEQLDRYGFYCQSRCTSCDERHYCHICGERYRMECMMKWAQMPLRGRREVDGSK